MRVVEKRPYRTIYALQDPTTLEIRYIGRTTLPLKTRLCNHVQKVESTPKGAWVDSLRRKGMTPLIYELEALSGNEHYAYINDSELFWISYFRFLGSNLTNCHHNGYKVKGEHLAKIAARQRAWADAGKPRRGYQRAAKALGVEPEDLVTKGI